MRFKVLGSIDAVCDGSSVSVGGPQQRRLLGVLLIGRGHIVSADRLVDVLWPDGDAPDGATRSLPTYVSRLRGALGDGHIVTTGPGYRLACDHASCDVDDFDALMAEAESAPPDRALECYDRALALWAGPDAFGEFGAEWWALAESTRLVELRAVAREERAAALMAIGHPGRAVPDLEGLIVEHPLRERPVTLLMHALVATGRQAEALRVFRAYRTRLAEETGLDPSADVVQLERTIAGGLETVGATSVGRPLRGYTIHELIGEGSNGRVYAATQPGTERRVAIKVIRPDLADSSAFIRRFEAEARLVARLEHPHIAPLYDYWREPGGAYLVFRLLAGGTARDSVISGGAWSVARVSQMVEEVGGALIAAHAAGVVHNDVTSNNVMLDDRGSAYLTDFGIAITKDDRSAGADPRVDVRDFGWTLWELLTGVAPGTDGTTSSIAGRPERAPRLLGRVAVPASLDAVLAKATSADGGYATMAELVLGWRAAVGRPEGVLSPVTSDERRAVDAARHAAARQLTQSTAAGVNPYKGLRPFDEADAGAFFGRDAVCDDLEEAVGRHRLVTVVGASGSGKSSLVRAGLVPRLRSAGRTVVTMVPGDDPVTALRVAVSEVASRRGRTNDLVALVRHVVTACGPLVVVIDQLEECWTVSRPDGRDQFLDVVVRMVEDGPDVRFVATIRADVFDKPLQDTRIGAEIGAGAFVLAPMTPAQLGDAITLPAARAGVAVDEAVVADLVTEAATQPGSLPLLQFTLAELYDRRIDGRIGPDALTAVGGMAGSIGRRAEQVYVSLDERSQEDSRELFTRLVTPGEGVPDTRRRARLSELSDGGRVVADSYIGARLLVTDCDHATREPTVEIAHEALLTRWTRLTEWVDADRRWLSQMQHLAAAARAWDERSRPSGDVDEAGFADSELYRGSRLEAVLEALPERGHELSQEERRFVEASREARDADRNSERRANRRLRRLLTVATCLVVVALVTGLFAFTQRQRADRSRRGAEITTLANRSLALRSSQRDAAALLAIEAHRLRSDSESMSALFGTFSRDPGFLGYHTYDGAARIEGAVVPNTNTAIIMIASPSPIEDNPPLRRVDLATGELGPPFEPIGPHDRGVLVAVSGDGRVAVGYGAQREESPDQPVELVAFDISTGTAIGPRIPTSRGLDARNLAVNGDGSQAALAGGVDGDVQIFDTATGKRLATIAPPPDVQPSALGRDTSAAGWAPGGQLYIGSSGTHLRQFDPVTFELVRDITVPTYATGGLLKFSDDGAFVVARGVIQRDDGTLAGSVARIDLADGTVAWTIPPDEWGFGNCDSFAFSVPEDRLWCGDYFGVIRGRSLSTGALDGTAIEHQRGWLSSLDLVGIDGTRTLVTMGRNTPSIGRWHVDGSGPITRDVADGSDYAEYSPDGQWMAVIGPSDDPPGFTMSVRDENDDRRELALPTGVVGGTWVDDASIGAITADGHVHVIDVQTGDSHDVALTVAPDWRQVARVADGQLAFGYADGHVDVFDVGTGVRQVRLQISTPDWPGQQPAVDQIAASQDGTLIYVTGRGLYQFDARTGRQLRRSSDTGIMSVAAANDGPIAVGRFDGTIGLLDPDDLSVRATLPGARGVASTLQFSVDGRFLFARANDNTMALYDVATRQRIGDPIPVGEADAHLRPDGLEIAVAHHDASGITLWSLDPITWARAACSVAGRNLTRAEWETYIADLAPYRASCPNLAFPPP